MTSSEYRYHIEKIYAEVIGVNDWLIKDDQFQEFVTVAKTAGTGNLVLENWKIYLSGGGASDDFYDWWCEYRPDKLEIEKVEVMESAGISGSVEGEKKKKSPFDSVKKIVGMGDIR